MGTQLNTQPQIFKNNVVVGSPAGGPAVYGLTVYGDISASGTIYGTGGGGGGGMVGGGGALAPNNILGTGTDTYTLTNYVDETASNYLAFIGGVAQRPDIDFTISGNAIVFNSPVGVGIEILVYAVMNVLAIEATAALDTVPIGSVFWYAVSAAPAGYLECNGQIVSKAGYLDLWTTVGDAFSAVALSANHFRVPDLRGEFIRGWDHGRNVDTGRNFGDSQQGSVMLTHVGQTAGGAMAIGGFNFDSAEAYTTPNVQSAGTQTNYSGNSLVGSRPRNVALLPCIKALKTVTGSTTTLNFIEKPAGPTNGQVLTYNGSTSTWVASAVPKELPVTATAQQVLTYNGSTSTWVASAVPTGGGGVTLPTGTNGQVLTYNGSTSTWVASAVISGSTSNITLGTAVTLTNQTSIDFTGIPSTAKRVTFCLTGFSTNGTSLPLVQLGSTTIQTSGYTGAAWAGSSNATNNSSGFNILNSSTGAAYVGHLIMTFIKPTGNTWVTSFAGGFETALIMVGGGSVTLAGALDRLRLTTTNGTDQFDAGTVNVMWE